MKSYLPTGICSLPIHCKADDYHRTNTVPMRFGNARICPCTGTVR